MSELEIATYSRARAGPYIPLLGILAAIWGASYLLIKIGLRGFEPTTLMAIRLSVASLILLGLVSVTLGRGALRGAPVGAYLLGLFNGAIPFTFIAWGEKHVDSGTAAIVNSATPLFVTLLAPYLASNERLTGVRLGGLLVGFGGVAWLVGLNPHSGWGFIAGTAAITLATVSYAIGSLYGKLLVARTDGTILATTSYLGAAAVLIPFGALQAPEHWPGWEPVLAVLALALVGTAFAQVLWFRLLATHGSSRSSLVSYLLPGVALIYGSVFLSEPLGINKLGAFALTLSGVAIAAGRRRR